MSIEMSIPLSVYTGFFFLLGASIGASIMCYIAEKRFEEINK